MGRVLNEATVVRNPDTRASTFLPAGTEVPAWAEDLVGDHLTAGGDYVAGGEDTSPAAPLEGLDRSGRPLDADGDGHVDPEDERGEPNLAPAVVADGPTEPPRAGRGSGLGAWKEYATAIGIDVPDDASRDAIIELVDEKNPR